MCTNKTKEGSRELHGKNVLHQMILDGGIPQTKHAVTRCVLTNVRAYVQIFWKEMQLVFYPFASQD